MSQNGTFEGKDWFKKMLNKKCRYYRLSQTTWPASAALK